MRVRKGSSVIAAVALVVCQGAALAGTGSPPSVDWTDAEGVRAALAAIEASRGSIVERLVGAHAEAAQAKGIDVETLRTALRSMRADRLLAATLAGSFEDLSAIVAQQADEEAHASRGVVVTKDGSGSGLNSWIGYTAGHNVASGSGSAVAAGTFNAATGQNAFVAAGQSNVAAGTSSMVIGGFDNQARVIDSLVGAGAGNRATGARSVVVGGGYNLASGQWSFIGGGGRQTVSSVGAGGTLEDNVASGAFSVVAGGQGNISSGPYASALGGALNAAQGAWASVVGGQANVASGVNSLAGGFLSTASGASSVALGNDTNAVGDGTVALGTHAIAIGDNSFVFADGAGVQNFNPTSGPGGWGGNRANTFSVRATGGTWFVTGLDGSGDPLTGVEVVPGSGSWSTYSDRKGKTEVEPVDVAQVLARLRDMPVTTWRYRTQDASIRHIGPMAQDFHAAFGVGENDTTISVVDAQGVALAAIQALATELAVKTERIEALERRLEAIESRLR